MEREDANRLLLEAGISDGVITRSHVYDCLSGHAYVVWLLERWGPDMHSVTTLGRGITLEDAVREWQAGRPRGRRGT